MYVRAAPTASAERFVESVRMYVMCPASYSRWASVIVFLTLNDSRVLAACCNVDVIKGAPGRVVVGRSSRDCTMKGLSRNRAIASSDCSADAGR